MPEKKKQHYVPKLLLRQFATDSERKKVNVFNIDTDFYKSDCPLKTQGQESYFYGEDGLIEDTLGKLEHAAAPVIHDIVEKMSLPKWGTNEHQHLFMFSLLMSFRTKNASDITNEIVDKTFQEMKKFDSRFSKAEYKDLHIGLREPAAFTLATAAKDIFKAYDLELVLLHNKTSTKFISSDHPSNRYNQYLEQRKHPGGNTGLFSKGLQVFFPITPDLMLVYFDKWAYKFGNKKDKVIQITNTNDVEQLNLLQLINCSSVVYSNKETSEHDLRKLADTAKKYRLNEKTKLFEINKRHIDKDGNEHIYFMHHGLDTLIKLRLSFVKQPSHAKSHILSDYVVQVRNENMRYINLT